MLIVPFLTVAAHVFVAEGDYQCHPGWTLFDAMCYAFSSDFLPWAEAMAMCQAYRATLAEPRGLDVNNWLKSEMKKRQIPHAWLGATDEFQEGTWEWVSDRTPLGPFTSWSQGEPNNAGQGESCLELHGDFDWYDTTCQRPQKFICQTQPDSDVIVG